MEDKFSLEYQYQLYLKRINLSEKNMHPQQKTQLKMTFFGACGQILILLRDEVSELPEGEDIKVLDEFLKQINDFYLTANNKQN